jgi:hypothetical protein
VEILWMKRAKAVEIRTMKYFSSRDPNDPRRFAMWTRPSCVASLDRLRTKRKIVAAPKPTRTTHT